MKTIESDNHSYQIKVQELQDQIRSDASAFEKETATAKANYEADLNAKSEIIKEIEGKLNAERGEC